MPTVMANCGMKVISSVSEIPEWWKSHILSIANKPAWTHLGISHDPARVFNRKHNSIINNTSQAYTVTNDL